MSNIYLLVFMVELEVMQGNRLSIGCDGKSAPELEDSLSLEWTRDEIKIGPNLGGEFNVYTDQSNSLGNLLS